MRQKTETANMQVNYMLDIEKAFAMYSEYEHIYDMSVLQNKI